MFTSDIMLLCKYCAERQFARIVFYKYKIIWMIYIEYDKYTIQNFLPSYTHIIIVYTLQFIYSYISDIFKYFFNMIKQNLFNFKQ